MRWKAETALDLWQVDRTATASDVMPPPVMYDRQAMPIVDAHMHIYPHHHPSGDLLQATSAYLETMDAAGITLAVNLSGSPEAIGQLGRLSHASHDRIHLSPGTYFKADAEDFWWSESDLVDFSQQPNIAGLKIWCKYHRPLFREHNQKVLEKQNELRIPATGMHIADPPARGFWKENYWQCISDAERVIRAYPHISFIMAHGFWLMTDDEGLDVLSVYLDCYPNLHVDLGAVYQWWDGPEPTYDTLRSFFIKYKDRILYGTDGNPHFTEKHHYEQSFAVLETTEKNIAPFFGEQDSQWSIHGLGLPLDVLNYIYYWNAARLIPSVRRQLSAMGYSVAQQDQVSC